MEEWSPDGGDLAIGVIFLCARNVSRLLRHSCEQTAETFMSLEDLRLAVSSIKVKER